MFNLLFPGLFADIAVAVVEDMQGVKGPFHGLGAFLYPLSAAVQMHVLDGSGAFAEIENGVEFSGIIAKTDSALVFGVRKVGDLVGKSRTGLGEVVDFEVETVKGKLICLVECLGLIGGKDAPEFGDGLGDKLLVEELTSLVAE